MRFHVWIWHVASSVMALLCRTSSIDDGYHARMFHGGNGTELRWSWLIQIVYRIVSKRVSTSKRIYPTHFRIVLFHLSHCQVGSLCISPQLKCHMQTEWNFACTRDTRQRSAGHYSSITKFLFISQPFSHSVAHPFGRRHLGECAKQ